MAVRCASGSSQYLDITSNCLDINADYTWCGWVRFASLGGYAFGSKGGGGTAYDNLEILYFSAGTELSIYCSTMGGGTGSDALGTTFATATWYHLTLTRSGNFVRAYVNGVLDGEVEFAVTGRPDSTSMQMCASWDGSQFCDARLWGWKAWSRALTVAEIQREMQQAAPNSGLSLFGWWPFLADNRATDFGGQAHTWTENNSPTTEDPPDVAFRPRASQEFVVPSATGITGTGDSVIAAPTSSGDGALGITGTGDSSIAAPASSGSGALAIAGAGTSSIAAPATEGSGALAITGTGNGVIAAPVSEGTGSEGDLTGTGDSVIAAPTSEGAGALSITGTGTSTIAAPTSSGSGTGFGEALAVVTWGQLSNTVSLAPGDEVRFALSAVAASITLDNVKVRIVVFAQRSGVPIVLREPKRMRPMR